METEPSPEAEIQFQRQREYETIDDDITKLEQKLADLDREILANAQIPAALNELTGEREETQSLLDEKTENGLSHWSWRKRSRRRSRLTENVSLRCTQRRNHYGKSPMTTLCYIEKDDSYLMLHRVSKKNDVNKDKWIGVGGHFEEGKAPMSV